MDGAVPVEEEQDTRALLVRGDCLEFLKRLDDNSIDAVVTDPPAGIAFMGKAWDRMKRDGMTELQAFQECIREVFTEVHRVLKPGGHAVVWALPRTSHHTAMGLERAGFDIRDNGTYLFHVFGSGFPKSLDVSKAIDKAAGAERERIKGSRSGGMASFNKGNAEQGYRDSAYYEEGNELLSNEPVTAAAAKAWAGFGTSLKPACEFWILARKPLDGTVAENVLAHGTGALNIDACRISSDGSHKVKGVVTKKTQVTGDTRSKAAAGMYAAGSSFTPTNHEGGRWPAHLILDEGAAAIMDAQSGPKSASFMRNRTDGARYFNNDGEPTGYTSQKIEADETDVVGASRFFYVAKANKRDKDEGLDALPERSPGEKTERAEGSAGITAYAGSRGPSKNSHPTVKSTALMTWLVRLVTPPGGLVLDPFMGSGSTGKAALREGFKFVGCEREQEYMEIAKARIEHELGGPVDVLDL